ncbi:stage III sporulation protein AD [Paraliobacillus sp. JSM ZJ581]|uniref:stage III sporulation protein AD n=1 Tax=Paraliobacillus sp. JSM ZJ581 TaxID=3342118 RepID=UPI0035A87E32
MMIIQIVSIGIVASLLVLLIKEQKPTYALFIIIFTSIIIFFIVMDYVSTVFGLIQLISSRANINDTYLHTILQIIGISYIAEFGAHITRDAGLESVAAKIELAGKLFIIVLAVPIISAVIETIIGFLPQ